MTRLKCNITEKDSEGDIYTEIEKKREEQSKTLKVQYFVLFFPLKTLSSKIYCISGEWETGRFYFLVTLSYFLFYTTLI